MIWVCSSLSILLAAGAASVAVISDLLETGDPTRRVAEFLHSYRGRDRFHCLTEGSLVTTTPD